MAPLVPQQENLAENMNIHGFRLEKVEPVKELHSTAYLFVHEKTGAVLLHLYNDDPNNLFSIAFRTPVFNSTGVAHILEHSVLCGSEKFPLKDPFQELLKGSLQTFLNALTYPDKTVYPVSSQVEKDFYNLVDVYCDAVLNPMLTENTFFQEGWHFDVEDKSRPVSIKGIVYNEMKGAFSNFSSHVERKTLSALFPDTTYYYESGGEPASITDLTYEEFKKFHKKYYHPSNSFIFLYGNLLSHKTLSFLNDNYLGSFEAIDVDSAVVPQKLWIEPRKLYVEAPAPKEDDGKATVALLWIFNDTVDPVTTLAGRIIGHYLLGTESSPLKRALVDSGLGEDLDDICGFDSELVQTVFAAGLRKCQPENAVKIEALILKTLEDQVQNGLDPDLLNGSLRQIEFGLREVTGGHFPYNLRLAERCYRSWIYDGDPLAHLTFEKPLDFLKKQLSGGTDYFVDLIKKRLLENTHRLLSVIVASSKKGEELEMQTEQHAQNLSSGFGENEMEKYYQLTKTLLEQQKTPSPPEAVEKLPKLKKSDLPRRGQEVEAEIVELNGVKVYMHPVFTSGIAYVDIGFDLRAIPGDLLAYIPVYTELITRCGACGLSYEQVAKRIALSTGGIVSSVNCRTMLGSEKDLFFHTFFHGKSLVPRFKDMMNIFRDLFLEPDLKNKKQIKDIILEGRNNLLSSVSSAGHHYAVTRASSFLCLSQYVNEILGGITQLRFINELAKNEEYDQVLESVIKLHEIVINRKACMISLTSDKPAEQLTYLEKVVNELPSKDFKPVSIGNENVKDRFDGIELNSAVNYVARVWKSGSMDPVTAGLLFLMSRNLSTGYLWDKIRVEGGAYGGMAMMSLSHPVFACASYRDPNLLTTLTHFESALKEIAKGITQDKVDQSIIGTIGKIDSPRSPHAKGFGETLNLISGNTKEFRQELRDTVLGSDSSALKNIAESVCTAKESAVVVIGGGASFDAAEKEGLHLNREPLV